VAALEQFMRDTAPPPAPDPPAVQRSAWARASLLEATGHAPDEPVAWGRRTNGGRPCSPSPSAQ